MIVLVPRMHVLIADKFEQSGLDGLKAAGCEVTYQPGLKTTRWRKRSSSCGPTCWWCGRRK